MSEETCVFGGSYHVEVSLTPQVRGRLYNGTDELWTSRPYPDLAEGNAVVLGEELKKSNVLPPEVEFYDKYFFEAAERARKQLLEDAMKNPLEFLDSALSKTVKYDGMVRKLVLLGQISAYGPNPLNIAIKGETTIGKSWIMLEAAKFLPNSDVIKYTDASPTAFYWKHSEIKCKEHGDKCPPETKCKAEKYKELHLGRKILIMLDQPSDALLQNLKPLLSHDEKELTRLTTDPSRKGSTKAIEIKLVGWPSIQYASCQQATDPEIASRLFIISPSDSVEKIGEVLDFMTEREKNHYSWQQQYEADIVVQTAKKLIQEIRDWTGQYKTIEIEKPYLSDYENRFNDKFPKSPRSMRTFPQFLSLIDALVLLHYKQRAQKISGNVLILTSTSEDAEEAFKIIEYFFDSLRYGLPPATIEFLNKIAIPLIKEKGTVCRRDLTKKYHDVKGRYLGEKYIVTYYLNPLTDRGLLLDYPDPTDRRRTLYTLPESNQEQNNGTKGWGVPPIMDDKGLIPPPSSIVFGVKPLLSKEAEPAKGHISPYPPVSGHIVSEPVPQLFNYGPNRKAVCGACYATKYDSLERLGVLAEGLCHDCRSPASLLIQLEEVST